MTDDSQQAVYPKLAWLAGMFRFLVAFLLLLGPSCLLSQIRLNGQVSDGTETPLSFCTLTLNGGQYGTITDERGFFSLSVAPGKYEIRVSRLGYLPFRDSILLSRDTTLRIPIKEEVLSLEEVVIVPGGEDPAYPIMRAAIRKKEENRLAARFYRFDAYTKTVFGFPERGFLLDTAVSLLGQTDSSITDELNRSPLFRTRILFLSEVSSVIWKGRGNQVKEAIRKSRTSGLPANISIFGGLFNQFDPYENLYFKGEIAERGIVSPLADQAMFFYRYKLLGVLEIDGQQIYKIGIQPKRRGDAAVRGIIHIADSSYAVQAIDITTNRDQAIQLVDSIRVTQSFVPENNQWLPVATRMNMVITLNLVAEKIPVQGSFSSVFSNYQFEDTDPPAGFFSSEIIAVADSAVLSDSTWWENQRPIPLNAREQLDFQLKDSVAALRSSPDYLDSLTRAQSMPGPLSIAVGYTWRNYRTGGTWYWKGLGRSGFNAIEGWYLASGIRANLPLNERISLIPDLDGRYGFSSRRFHWKAGIGLQGKGFRPWFVGLRAGDYPQEYASIPQIVPFANTYASMIHHRSHIRFYRARFLEGNVTWEPLPGLNLDASLRSEDRSTLSNTSEYSFRFPDRTYEENFDILSHRATIGEVAIRYRPFTRYIRLPDGKRSLGSSWPELELKLTQALPGASTLSPSYTRLRLSLRDDISTGRLGTLSYRVSAGQFLVNNRSYLPDYFHFHGGETFFRMGEKFDEFFLMPYYAYSDVSPFLEFHGEQAFGILGVSRIPGLRKLKMSEYAGVHGLMMQGRDPYLEVNYGIEMRFLKVMKLRLDMHVWLMGEDRWLPYAFTWRPTTLFDPGNPSP